MNLDNFLLQAIQYAGKPLVIGEATVQALLSPVTAGDPMEYGGSDKTRSLTAVVRRADLAVLPVVHGRVTVAEEPYAGVYRIHAIVASAITPVVKLDLRKEP
jgi:hypothetical protein